MIKIFFALAISFFIVSCGVKGIPQAPLEPAKIGRGEPAYSTQSPMRPKIKNKYNYDLEKGDRDTEDDED